MVVVVSCGYNVGGTSTMELVEGFRFSGFMEGGRS